MGGIITSKEIQIYLDMLSYNLLKILFLRYKEK